MPASDGSSVRVQQMPPAIEGEWYGVETRVLQEKEVRHGDVRDRYFTDWNVDLTEQLVNMIVAQRNFQANAQMISTQDQTTQTVINIR